MDWLQVHSMSIEELTKALMDLSEGEAWIRFKPKQTVKVLGSEAADAIETILGEAGRRSKAPYELGTKVPLREFKLVLCRAIAESLLNQKTGDSDDG
ncbi:MAG: hypothetical protein OXF25_07630 [Cyanobacteria bacterium MAG CAR3_bin_5]|nr:hypothetical protein [Cyanobacteria bacterium MAG CAR3_bin_5]MCY4236612.1 hypothetical protein [Cyanobacteria bacterium MAG CAR2_bin_4]MCY4331233.1 hypothetical protein [Cyanobacteria bacterium MAG CAR1_bin_15]